MKKVTMDWGTYQQELRDSNTKGWNEARAQVARIIGVKMNYNFEDERSVRGVPMLVELEDGRTHSDMVLKLFDEFWPPMED